MANYIDSEELHNLLIQWKMDKQNNKPMSNELGKAFYQIINGILSKPKYIKIKPDIKDDLKSIAVLNLVKYIHSYNPDKIKSKNGAFTYITYSAECSIKGELKKRNEKNEKLPIVFDSTIIETMDIPYLP